MCTVTYDAGLCGMYEKFSFFVVVCALKCCDRMGTEKRVHEVCL